MLDAGTFWCARCASCNAGSRRSCTSHRAARLNARGQRDQREILRLDPLPQRVHRLEGERHDHRQGAAGARAARAASAGHAAGRRRARGRGALESSRVLRVGWVWTTTVVAAKSNSLRATNASSWHHTKRRQILARSEGLFLSHLSTRLGSPGNYAVRIPPTQGRNEARHNPDAPRRTRARRRPGARAARGAHKRGSPGVVWAGVCILEPLEGGRRNGQGSRGWAAQDCDVRAGGRARSAPACPHADSLSSGSSRRAECRPRRLAGRRCRIWAAQSRRHHSGMPWSSRSPPLGGTTGGGGAGPVSWFHSARRLSVLCVVSCGLGWGGGVHHSACVARPPGRMRRSVACTAPMPAVVCVWLALLCVADRAWGLN